MIKLDLIIIHQFSRKVHFILKILE